MSETRSRVWRKAKPVAVVGIIVFGLIQAVPYGWSRTNPPVTSTPPWPTLEGATLARAACYDCHSNETDWPWYSGIAPMSWLVRYDVERGRRALNFSTWGTEDQDAGEAAEAVEDGSMPFDRYAWLHSDARLSDSERRELIAALEAMDGDGGGGNSGPGGGGGDAGGNSEPGGGGGDAGGNSGPGGGGGDAGDNSGPGGGG